MNNVNNINRQSGAFMGANNSNQQLPIKYKILKSGYDDFLKKINGGDFKNSPTSYISEKTHLELLIETCEQYGLNSEKQEHEQRLQEVLSHLKERGITFKE